MCFTFKKKGTKIPVNRFLQDGASAGLQSLQTCIVIKLSKGHGKAILITRLDEETKTQRGVFNLGGGTLILGHIRDVRQEWVSFPGRKAADGCKFFTKNLGKGHNFDIILPGNGWFYSKLDETYCSLVNFYCK